MKLNIEVDLGIVDVETDSEHGNIDSVYFGGIDATNLTVADLILKIMSEQKWSEMVAQAYYHELDAYTPPRDDGDDVVGHPV